MNIETIKTMPVMSFRSGPDIYASFNVLTHQSLISRFPHLYDFSNGL